MPFDPYQDFAARYDLFFADPEKSDPEHEKFFRELFAEHGVRRVLDCACGTGRDLVMLKVLGFDVCGSDISDAMLAQAAKTLSARGLDVPLTKADFRGLERKFQPVFNAVLCLSTSLPHLHKEDDLVWALLSMMAVLKDGGLLVLSQGITDRQWRERPRFIPAVNTRDFSRVFVLDYLETTVRMHVLDLFHGEDPGARSFKAESFEYRVLLRDDYDRLLTRAGYRDRWYYGGFDRSPYDPQTSERLVVVARK